MQLISSVEKPTIRTQMVTCEFLNGLNKHIKGQSFNLYFVANDW